MILFGNDAPLPFNRDALTRGLACEGNVDQITSLDKMEEHDFGWMSALRLLDPAVTVQPREALCAATPEINTVNPNLPTRRKKGNG